MALRVGASCRTPPLTRGQVCRQCRLADPDPRAALARDVDPWEVAAPDQSVDGLRVDTQHLGGISYRQQTIHHAASCQYAGTISKTPSNVAGIPSGSMYDRRSLMTASSCAMNSSPTGEPRRTR